MKECYSQLHDINSIFSLYSFFSHDSCQAESHWVSSWQVGGRTKQKVGCFCRRKSKRASLYHCNCHLMSTQHHPCSHHAESITNIQKASCSPCASDKSRGGRPQRSRERFWIASNTTVRSREMTERGSSLPITALPDTIMLAPACMGQPHEETKNTHGEGHSKTIYGVNSIYRTCGCAHYTSAHL